MRDDALQDRRAAYVAAINGGHFGIGVNRASADRAFVGRNDLLFGAVALVFQNSHDVGDDLAGFLHQYGVADSYVEALHFVEIVERGAGDVGPGQAHGLKVGDRRYGAGPADLQRHGKKFRLGALRRELVGDGPARGLGGGAQFFPQGETVNFNYYSVGGEGKREALLLPLFAESHGVPDIAADPAGGGRGKAQLFVGRQKFQIVEGGEAGGGVGHEGQFSFRGDGGVVLLQAARRGVPGVGEKRFVVFKSFFVQALQFLEGKQYFASHVERSFWGVLQEEGNVFDGPQIGGDVVAFFTVAPGGAQSEPAVNVS